LGLQLGRGQRTQKAEGLILRAVGAERRGDVRQVHAASCIRSPPLRKKHLPPRFNPCSSLIQRGLLRPGGIASEAGGSIRSEPSTALVIS
jgi:hypothetical protein